ncbi:double-strand break repair helicase AddA [Microvirga lotononidis]|uniref:DNA 3'-5' helicase n=1 Tax=Microvirga lotononidis TaxID=864069 RepID=I4YYL4_9HYPH|nr:double-strand break repair helicase AddA [Microvirga lotononidis]EIM29056.1 double-strand break repair helicase AddA, alphaproteobacterial type [Microvirga lotononidis]WQO28901.1 double-strand break repair helicase AddA [Microvirga lotononidis]
MSTDLVIPEYTKDAQRRAANPRASAWVSANAGAGKTKVLTDRVVRLLLAGSLPGRILCLTFTKAAAANMAIRVFERLGRWVTLDEESLVRELTELEGEKPTRQQVKLARTLFARAVETPGGLKIDTIHAFCERLLHLVPFEANVPARFAVLDESQTDEMLSQATANVMADAASGNFPALAEALDIISVDAVGDALAGAINAALKCKNFLHDATGPARLRRELGLGADETLESVETAMLEGGIGPDEWPAIAQELLAGKATDQKRAASFIAAAEAKERSEKLENYLSIFLTDAGTPRKGSAFLTKDVGESLKDLLLREQERVCSLIDKRKAARAAERTGALFTLAAEIHARVEQAKMRLGALDFQDLIDKTLALLSRGDTAWVLYKLDRGIDHVLIDEAQDTNPEQWEILRRITEDFTSGAGAAASRVRTLFAVGDPKQSIYGFQGAAPQEFETTRRSWSQKVKNAELHFEDVSLTMSFRSGRAVLSAVDATFAVEANFKGLSFEDKAVGTVHESARPHAPGLVEMWPLEMPAKEEEPEAWVLPIDEPEQHSPPVVVARRIAQAVKCWTTKGDETGRVWSAGDVLVLVRKRGAAFEAVIRALKEAGVPVAGADRLNIGEHIAVLDLVAAGRAALLPDDDLTLATALKSPLVGLTDDDLIRIAADRADAESLHAAMTRHAEAGDVKARRGCEALGAWRELARVHGPFGFFATLLGPRGGRSLLVARLGSEAGDAIDAFLCFAHQSEMTETPSLTVFLSRFESASHTIKRDLDSVNNEVRVMTVHGAKGLEAPIVVLIDGCEVLGRDPPLLQLQSATGGKIPVWAPGKTSDSSVMAQARELLHAKGYEEHNRLLYVAMTRAKDRLVIAPYRTNGNETRQEAWCEMIRHGLVAKAGGLELDKAPYGEIAVWREGSPLARTLAAESDVPPLDPIAVPGWLTTAAAPEPEPLPPIRPSSALGAADRMTRPGDGPYAPEARLRGTLVHALLERLPALAPEHREGMARTYIKARAPRLPQDLREAILTNALGVLDHPDLKPLFGQGSRAEAPIAGRVLTVEGEILVSGQIDRLAVLDSDVLVADFKTTARAPKPGQPPPRSYVAQLALYRTLLAEIYPEKRIRTFLIWTSGPVIHELLEPELESALTLIKAA